MNFLHLTVNHSKNFIDPENKEVHTQSIEAFWMVLKNKLQKRGGPNFTKNIGNYLGEHLYKRKYNLDIFNHFIDHLQKYY